MSDVGISTVFVFLSVFVAFLGVSSAFKTDSGRLRLWRIKSSQAALAEDGAFEDPSGILYGETSPLMKKLAPVAQAIPQQNHEDESELRRRLVQAGFRRRDAARIYTVLRILGLAGVGVTGAVTAKTFGLSEVSALGITVVGAIVFFLAPSMYLDRRIKFRQSSVDTALPPAIDLLAISVDAGMSTSQAVARVAKEFRRISPVLSEELELVTMQTSAGRTNADSMRDLANRVGSKELGLLVNMLIQTDRFGTNIADALRSHSDELRTFRLQAAEERAGKAAIMMLIPTSLIMVSILIVILGLGAIKASQLLS
jgi:tight adherence protein C